MYTKYNFHQQILHFLTLPTGSVFEMYLYATNEFFFFESVTNRGNGIF